MTERQLRVMAEVAGEQDRLREYIAECRGIHLEFE
jgi:hypothetical protein